MTQRQILESDQSLLCFSNISITLQLYLPFKFFFFVKKEIAMLKYLCDLDDYQMANKHRLLDLLLQFSDNVIHQAALRTSRKPWPLTKKNIRCQKSVIWNWKFKLLRKILNNYFQEIETQNEILLFPSLSDSDFQINKPLKNFEIWEGMEHKCTVLY